ncbi:MAG: type II toxin-antitoxin system HicB family antitoxin [Crocosphaera sp.]
MINNLQQNIHAIIRAGNEKGYVAECVEISVITQGMTLDAVSKNLVEAVSLHLEDDNLSELGFVSKPSLVVTFELQPEYA